jgi:hypothetical protein
VHRRYPVLAQAQRDVDPDVYAGQVRAAMLALSHWHRTPGKLDHKLARVAWRDRATELLRSIGWATTGFQGSSFFTAAIACGDVPYDDPSLYPYCDIGVVTGVRRDSAAPTSAWVHILDGKFPDMIVRREQPVHDWKPGKQFNLVPEIAGRVERIERRGSPRSSNLRRGLGAPSSCGRPWGEVRLRRPRPPSIANPPRRGPRRSGGGVAFPPLPKGRQSFYIK